MAPAPYTSPLAQALAPDLLQRFLRYVRIDTQSRRERERSPSTPGQLELGALLVAELQNAGLADANLDEHGYVTATLPASEGAADGASNGSPGPVVGLIAHMDTSPDAPGKGVQPIVHPNYAGGAIQLPRQGTKLDPASMPALAAKAGHDIVTSSGDTLLGADDKAGVAEIVTAVAHLAVHPELPRPTLRIGFTPDEEIGEGATLFQIEHFGALCAYTIDGSELGELQDETFSADEVIIKVHGVDVHPGQATGKLVSALRLAARIVTALPTDTLTPATSAGREGFIHPYELTGTPGLAQLRVIVRDFDEDKLAEHVALLQRAAREAVDSEPGARLELEVRRQYRNMRTQLEPVPYVTAAAEIAIRAEGIEPLRSPIRGGTDGSRLSEMGLPTPNLFTGGHEYHSVREWASVQDMAAAAATIVRLAEVWTRPDRFGAPPGRLRPMTDQHASLASLDGEIMPAAEARIPATDDGLLRGDGAFEVIRVYEGRPFALEQHLARLKRSAASLRLALDLEAVRTDAHRLLAHAGPAAEHELLRIVLTRGGRRLLLTEPLPPAMERIRLGSVTYSPTRVLDGVKSLSYAGNMLAGRLAREQGFDEALLVTPHGRVLEAPTSSIFWVTGERILTPPLSEHILASITRALVIELTSAQERACTLAELTGADEAFLASTTREVQPIGAVDEHVFGEASPVTGQAAAALGAHIRSELTRS